MGKFLGGCLIVGLLLIAGVGGGGYYFVYKPLSEFGGDIVRITKEYQELDGKVADRSSYAPPRDGVLSEEQFQRFLAVQRHMRSGMEARFSELEEKYEALRQRADGERGSPGVTEMASAYREIGDLLVLAKRQQVEALNQQRFSLEEYKWVREQAYQALGASVGVASLLDSEATAAGQIQVPQQTIEMVSPYREELMELHLFAWWGL